MAQTTGRNLPPPQSAFVDKLLNLSNDGYQYLLSLLALAGAATPTASVATGLTATGLNSQATALQLTSDWNEVDTVVAGSGVLLQFRQVGQSQTVFNQGLSPLSVYPPPGMRIDGGDVNAAFALAAGLRHTFDFLSSTQIRS